MTFDPVGSAVCRSMFRLFETSADKLTMLGPYLAPIAVPLAGNADVNADDVPPAACPAAILTRRLPLPSVFSGTITPPFCAPTGVPETGN